MTTHDKRRIMSESATRKKELTHFRLVTLVAEDLQRRQVISRTLLDEWEAPCFVLNEA